MGWVYTDPEIIPTIPDLDNASEGNSMHDRETILSRTITHPNRIELAPHCQGVAVIIFNPNHDVLLVQQRHEDALYGRTPGQWNIVTEGRKAEYQETNERVRNTVQRALWEELGRTPDDFRILDGTYRETNGEYTNRMGYQYFYRCIAIQCILSDYKNPNVLFRSHDGEIAQYAWVPFHRLHEYDIEYGARLVLEYYRMTKIF